MLNLNNLLYYMNCQGSHLFLHKNVVNITKNNVAVDWLFIIKTVKNSKKKKKTVSTDDLGAHKNFVVIFFLFSFFGGNFWGFIIESLRRELCFLITKQQQQQTGRGRAG